MSVSELYTIKAITVGPTAGPTHIGQITDQSVSDDISELLTGDSGDIYNRDVSIARQDTRFKITTEAVKTALGAIGLTGLAITALAPVIVYFQPYSAGGTRDTTACVAFKFVKGIVLLRSVSANAGSLATVELEIIGVSDDGTNAPAEKLTAQTAPATTTSEMYVASGVGVQGWDIDTGINAQLIGDTGETWNTHVSIERIQPAVTLRKTAMGALGVTSLGSVTLIDRLSGGLNGSSPITFTFNQQMGTARNIGGRPAITEYNITPTYDDSNAPIVITGL